MILCVGPDYFSGFFLCGSPGQLGWPGAARRGAMNDQAVAFPPAKPSNVEVNPSVRSA